MATRLPAPRAAEGCQCPETVSALAHGLWLALPEGPTAQRFRGARAAPMRYGRVGRGVVLPEAVSALSLRRRGGGPGHWPQAKEAKEAKPIGQRPKGQAAAV